MTKATGRPRGRPRTKLYWRYELETASLAQDMLTKPDMLTPDKLIEHAHDAGIINAGQKQIWDRVLKNCARAGHPPEEIAASFVRKYHVMSEMS
ncbi:hypothetical protein [Phyllobacterium zundukense]|uniref:Uncharacterized protein n=1 Tax=Phyllobacterium zundukense TaxID=1867719 RepID=A0A2N9W057_9HYPH|nr:hypothetical protein [Phyllobacterium zundukense]ATU90634.1 hypothetical protein BLM14_02400 [Phyllobacterium zundukense]PIO45125.1 hypothetical protein B5P45_08760 [Phyllobacterium zundukense]